jgi:Sec-independent protein translocase protein TatA
MLGSLLQPVHLLILFLIVVFLFGGRLFANLGKGFAGAVRNYKSSVRSSDKHDGSD